MSINRCKEKENTKDLLKELAYKVMNTTVRFNKIVIKFKNDVNSLVKEVNIKGGDTVTFEDVTTFVNNDVIYLIQDSHFVVYFKWEDITEMKFN